MDKLPALPSMAAEDARLEQLIARMKTLEDSNTAAELGPEFQQAMREMHSIQAELKAINDEVKATMRVMQDNLAHITDALQSDIVAEALAAAEADGMLPPVPSDAPDNE